MSRPGLRSRAITYTYAAVALVGAFVAALMVMPSEGAVEKIGPGYARMQPIDEGKAEKVTYSVPYCSGQVACSRGQTGASHPRNRWSRS